MRRGHRVFALVELVGQDHDRVVELANRSAQVLDVRMDALGGQLALHSPVHEGSTVRAELPLR